MLKNLLFACILGLATQSVTAQSYSRPYTHHLHQGSVSYGWGYTPIINGAWYWGHYGLNYPSWNNYGYPNYNNYPVQYYAAISYSPSTGRYGSAWGEINRLTAVRSATAYCVANDCRPTVWVADGCAAVAKNENSGSIGWAYAANKYRAIRNANNSCQNSSLETCVNVAWVCSGN